jgi:biopolymer transport protein ExbD
MFRNEGKKEVPGMGTGSSSDIVFMLLFFFMVTTQLRSTENKVQVKIPSASEAVKLERKDLASYINVGTPIRSLQAQYGNETRIQLNDSFRTTKDIRDFVAAERESMSEADRAFMTVCIKADENTRMGIITDIKQELRRCSALKIMYTASRAQ